jgi:putative membrane protein
MHTLSTVTATALLAAASVAGAQTAGQMGAENSTQAPGTPMQTDPSAASSPHQRQSTGAAGTETPEMGSNGANPSAASSPHQREALKGSSRAELEEAQKAGATPAAFVKTAAEDGMTEIALAKLAETKSSNSDIKQFAQKMERDHGQANEQLAQLAKSKGLTVPSTLDKKHEAMVTAMSHKSGAAFDASYSEHMAKAHAKAVALFQSAAQSSDKDLAAFASKILPTLQDHQQMANNLEHEHGSKRTASAPTPSNR